MGNSSSREVNEHTLRGIIAIYWRAYGGWRDVVSSPFLWLSAGLTLLTYRLWLHGEWWTYPLSVMPSLLGFTLGGFAIFLGFGDERFKAIIAGEEQDATGASNGPSPYMKVCSAFLHFVLVQVVALLVALVGAATNFSGTGILTCVTNTLRPIRWVGDMVGYWIFVYGLCLAAAAAIAVFRVAYWFDHYRTLTNQQGDDAQTTQ
jgi:hypothetical protein